MKARLTVTAVTLSFLCGLCALTCLAGIEPILGRWEVKAEGPNGPLDLEFAFRLEGNQIVGTATSYQGSVPLSAIKFEEPNLAMEIVIGDATYKLKAILKTDSLEGTWEREGSELKGTWTGKRGAPPAAGTPAARAAGGILGTWNTVAVTTNGDTAATLELKQADGTMSGVISSDMGSLPVQAVSFKENKLQFDIELGGTVYHVQAALEGDKLNGGWAPAAGGEGGAWKAVRKPAPAAGVPAAQPAPMIVGAWDVVAVTPDGNMQFVAEVGHSGQALKGTLKAPDGAIEMKNVTFADNKLAFEVDYMGGTYRIEAMLANDKLTGKWAAVGGSDSGTLTGERRKP